MSALRQVKPKSNPYRSVSEGDESKPTARCSKCHEEKPATLEFFSAYKRNKSGLKSWCRKCSNEVTKLHHAGIRAEHVLNKIPRRVLVCGSDTAVHQFVVGKLVARIDDYYVIKYGPREEDVCWAKEIEIEDEVA